MRNDSSVTQAAKVHAFWFYAYCGEVMKPLNNYERRSPSYRASVFYCQRYCAVELLN